MTRTIIQFGSFINISIALLCSSMLTSAFLLQYGAEFRRFSVDRLKPGKFEEFYKLIMTIHRIANMEVMIGYADVHGDLLPINNDWELQQGRVDLTPPAADIYPETRYELSLTSHPHPFILCVPVFPCTVCFFEVDVPSLTLSGDSSWIAERSSQVIGLREALHSNMGFKSPWPQLRIIQWGVKIQQNVEYKFSTYLQSDEWRFSP